ncbi:hypothetical protein MMC17_006325 [Xylographa soralifera]|nr:hypothetical protein [Xylographa soralifera]
MPPRLKINVTGESVVSRHAERGVLSIAVSSQGPSQETVSQDVTLASNHLRTTFKAASPKTASGEAALDAAITVFSMTALNTQTWIPQDRSGNPLPPRLYSAKCNFHVIFRDFDKLAEVASMLFTTPHVSIESTKWRLTDDTLAGLASESRKMAMRDAVRKANDFAEVIGRQVFAVEITDHGSSTGQRTKQTARMERPPVDAKGIGTLALEPEDVELTASVEVKFADE